MPPRAESAPISAGERLVNKSELVSRLTARLDGDRAKAMAAVNGVLEEIEQSLARGEKVSLLGFGTFDRRERGPRTARNPATGETIQVGASVAPVFRAGAGLRQLLAEAAGTARSVAAQATSAVTAVPAMAAGVTAPAIKAATKATSQGSKAGSKGSSKASSKAGSKASVKAESKAASKAASKAESKAADKARTKTAAGGAGKASNKTGGKSPKKG
ncbi:hypothetical protein GCM10010531_06190 [Blastococcus jejuensis]|uniref:DNA-binding protein HU-beta n=1 Tax=Blastococcus jejuensis TaxID=351224 RepID=A0ABP6NSU0_9ACTN